jgi:hypothetical protein
MKKYYSRQERMDEVVEQNGHAFQLTFQKYTLGRPVQQLAAQGGWGELDYARGNTWKSRVLFTPDERPSNDIRNIEYVKQRLFFVRSAAKRCVEFWA